MSSIWRDKRETIYKKHLSRVRTVHPIIRCFPVLRGQSIQRQEKMGPKSTFIMPHDKQWFNRVLPYSRRRTPRIAASLFNRLSTHAS